MKNNQQDLAAITKAIENNYFNGIYEGDVVKLREIYYGHAMVLGDVKGLPYCKTVEEYLEGVKNRQSVKDSGKPFKGTILSIEVINSIAIAKLHVKMYDFNYDDLLSFHKIDGRWLIVNKLMTDVTE